LCGPPAISDHTQYQVEFRWRYLLLEKVSTKEKLKVMSKAIIIISRES